MKIYVVTSGFYSDYHIAKVFTDKKAAEAYCNTMDLYNLYDDEIAQELKYTKQVKRKNSKQNG